jgi:hypothetical protein
MMPAVKWICLTVAGLAVWFTLVGAVVTFWGCK